MTTNDTERAAIANVLSGLRESVDRLEESAKGMASQEYVEQFTTSERQRRRRIAQLVIGIGVCFLVLFGLLFYGVLAIRGIAEQNIRNSEYLVQCTTPSSPGHPHPCYDDNIRRSEKIRKEIVRDTARAILRDMKRQQGH